MNILNSRAATHIVIGASLMMGAAQWFIREGVSIKAGESTIRAYAFPELGFVGIDQIRGSIDEPAQGDDYRYGQMLLGFVGENGEFGLTTWTIEGNATKERKQILSPFWQP